LRDCVLKLAPKPEKRDHPRMTLWPRLAGTIMLLVAAACPAPAMAEASDIAAAARGVVRVVIIGRDGDEIYPVSHGTGFSVGGERFVTNAHVVAEMVDDPSLAIGMVPPEGGDAVYARLVAVSQRNDLALLETTTPMKLPALTIAGNPATTGSVTAIGYPMNVDRAQGLGGSDIFRAMPPVTSTGFLSGRRPSVEFDTLLHTAPIARGNSGGPLVDDCGRLVGINSFGADTSNAEGEFFFAVSTRELLPFLRANNVSPRLNSSPCRSIAELNAAENQRTEREQAADAAHTAEEEAALALRTDDLRRTFTYAVIDDRANLTALALLALIAGLGSATLAIFAHRKQDGRLRAIGGGAALIALVGAAAAWVLRPDFSDIETRLQDALRADTQLPASGTIDPALAVSSTASATPAPLTCVLDPERSRVVTMSEDDVPLQWAADGCVNTRTQYGLDNGQWTRVFVPADEAAVSINRYDPATHEYVVERYLLDQPTMAAARTARAGYQLPRCGAGEAAAQALGDAQHAVVAALPQSPNERLVYRCGGNTPDN